jgi:FSR family fosmidomycin resistance protein-like MFS transporter
MSLAPSADVRFPAHALSWPSRLVLSRLFAGHFVSDIYAGFMLPLLPLLAKELGFSLGATGLLLTFSSFSSSVLQPLVGSWTDRARHINFAMIGVGLAALFISAIGWSSSFEMLVALILLGYLGVGMFHPQATTMTHELGRHNKNLIMGTFISIGTLGFATGPFLSSWLVTHGGLQATIWAVIPGLIGMAMLWGVQKALAPHPDHALPEASAESHAPFSPSERRVLWLLSVIGICRAVLLVGLPTFMPFIWTAENHTLLTIGTVSAISSFLGCPFGLIGGYLGDRIGEKAVIFGSFLPTLVLLPWMLQETGLNAFVLFVLMIGFLEASLATSLVVGLRHITHRPNTVSAIVGGFSWGLAGLLMPAIGWMGDQVGLASTLMTLVIPAVIALVATLMLPKPPKMALHPVV